MKNITITGLITGVIAATVAVSYIHIPAADKDLLGSALLSSAHLFSLAFGLPGVFLRGIFLRARLSEPENLSRMLAADNAWGFAALVWIITGLLRAFSGFEKGSDFYLNSPMFHMKLGLFSLIFLLELWPMITFINWRRLASSQKTIDFKFQRWFELITFAETLLVIVMVFIAGFMARGIFA